MVNMMLILLLGSSATLWANNAEKEAQNRLVNDTQQSTRNGNYDVSTLYLTTASGVAIQVILDNKRADESRNEDKTSVFEGVKPGNYLLKVSQQMTLNKTSRRAKISSRDVVSEKIIFYERIEIPARKVIYAFIDKDGNFIIAKQRKIITIW